METQGKEVETQGKAVKQIRRDSAKLTMTTVHRALTRPMKLAIRSSCARKGTALAMKTGLMH